MFSFVGCEQGKAIMKEHDDKIFVSYFCDIILCIFWLNLLKRVLLREVTPCIF